MNALNKYNELFNKELLVEETRDGLIKTKYVVIKAALVILYVTKLNEEGLRRGVDYFILGEGDYRQIHTIIKGEVK
jgi:hypothetical protein